MLLMSSGMQDGSRATVNPGGEPVLNRVVLDCLPKKNTSRFQTGSPARPPAPRGRTMSSMRKFTIVAGLILLASLAAAEDKNPRFGRWKLKSDAPAPQSNIMTYEPL